jgi:hypothetical protein
VKFIDYRQVSEEAVDYVFELEMIALRLKEPDFIKKRFPVASLLIAGIAITLTRNIDYYFIRGRIPLNTFEEICSDGWKEEIIPGGKRGPQGNSANAVYFDADGKKIVTQADFDKIKETVGNHSQWLKLIHPVPSREEFSNFGTGYILDCEIYSLEGLQHFISAIKLDQVLSAYQ